MKKHSIIGAVIGAFVWHRLLAPLKNTLTLVVPKHEEQLTQVLLDFLNCTSPNGPIPDMEIALVISDTVLIEQLKGKTSKRLIFIQLSENKMDKLLDYVAISYKQYGATCNPRVKLISLDEPYSGQLRVVEQNNIYEIRTLIKEMIMERV